MAKENKINAEKKNEQILLLERSLEDPEVTISVLENKASCDNSFSLGRSPFWPLNYCYFFCPSSHTLPHVINQRKQNTMVYSSLFVITIFDIFLVSSKKRTYTQVQSNAACEKGRRKYKKWTPLEEDALRKETDKCVFYFYFLYLLKKAIKICLLTIYFIYASRHGAGN